MYGKLLFHKGCLTVDGKQITWLDVVRNARFDFQPIADVQKAEEIFQLLLSTLLCPSPNAIFVFAYL